MNGGPYREDGQEPDTKARLRRRLREARVLNLCLLAAALISFVLTLQASGRAEHERQEHAYLQGRINELDRRLETEREDARRAQFDLSMCESDRRIADSLARAEQVRLEILCGTRYLVLDSE